MRTAAFQLSIGLNHVVLGRMLVEGVAGVCLWALTTFFWITLIHHSLLDVRPWMRGLRPCDHRLLLPKARQTIFERMHR